MRALDLHDIAVEVAEMVDNSLEDKKSNANNLRLAEKYCDFRDPCISIRNIVSSHSVRLVIVET